MAKPFLKWAGGKRQLLDEIRARLPKSIDEMDTYIEPFIGGGAVLFDMLKRFNFKNVHISDINPELVLCYRQIQSSVEEVNQYLEHLIENYPKNSEKRDEYYYALRESWNANLDINSMTNKQKSYRVAQMIFLNKTCFNGLFRLNRSGKFNVPTGRYKNPSFPSAECLIEVSKALQGVIIHNTRYEECIKWVENKTFVYFDPPYRPLSKTSSFISYSKGDFNDENQVELANLAKKLDKMEAFFLLSNSDPKNTIKDDNFFDELYSQFQIDRVFARRAINSNPDRRGKISELLIQNY